MNWILWIAVVAVASWLVLGATFLAYPTVQRLKPMEDEVSWIMKVPVYFLLAVGITADVVFNAFWGTIIFRERPKEWLFTDRLKRHWRGSDEKQKKRAEKWVWRVNLIDPGHVK